MSMGRISERKNCVCITGPSGFNISACTVQLQCTTIPILMWVVGSPDIGLALARVP